MPELRRAGPGDGSCFLLLDNQVECGGLGRRAAGSGDGEGVSLGRLVKESAGAASNEYSDAGQSDGCHGSYQERSPLTASAIEESEWQHQSEECGSCIAHAQGGRRPSAKRG